MLNFIGKGKSHLREAFCDDYCLYFLPTECIKIFPPILKLKKLIWTSIAKFLSGIGIDVTHNKINWHLCV